jgi:hypothetical protein
MNCMVNHSPGSPETENRESMRQGHGERPEPLRYVPFKADGRFRESMAWPTITRFKCLYTVGDEKNNCFTDVIIKGWFKI